MNSINEELIDAMFENNLPEIRRLLSVGADVNAQRRSIGYMMPLHWASMKGHVQVVVELLEHGADIEAKDNRGWRPLHWAAINDRLAVVVELLSPGDEIHANDSDGATPSILGKRKSRGGAIIDAKDNEGDTPLHIASHCGHLPIVKALLAVGADILVADNQGRLIIHSAVTNRHSAVSKYLLQHFYATTRRLPLHELVEDLTWIGNPSSIDIDIDIDIEIDVPPLYYALDRNVLGTDDVVEILEYLVDRDPALLSSRDQDGSLPLHVACRRGASFAIVQSLVNLYKASVRSVTPRGDLPLFLACEMPEPSLDSIFLMMKLYPDLVYDRENSGLRRSGRDRRAPVRFS
jgi:ankyrin repeat protein